MISTKEAPMRRRSRWFTLVVMATACGPTAVGDDDPIDASRRPDGGGGADDGPVVAETRHCDQIDLLFVIDDSDSMGQEQDNLAANFPAFIEVLEQARTPDGVPIDYRVGVTTTGRDLRLVPPPPLPPIGGQVQAGLNGALVQPAGCGMTRRWIQRGDPAVASTFACAARVGTDGPTVEMPLLMGTWALTDRMADGTNAGFRRPDALLALVILTDEEDCSQTGADVPATDVGLCDQSRPAVVTPAQVAAQLDAVAGGHARWAVAAIAGPGPLVCESQFGRAAPATRVKELVTLAGDNGVFSSICDGDLAVGLRAALDTFQNACAEIPVD
jgi:hypothetical protein